MSLHLFVGPAGSGKSTKLNNIIKDIDSQNVIYIVPEQYALSAEKKLALLCKGQGIMNVEVLSFSRLSYKLMDEAGEVELPVLDDVGKTLLIKRIMQEKKDQLTVFKGKENNLGFLKEVMDIISELSQYCITPESLNIIDKLHSFNLQLKTKDILLIYNEYLERTRNSFKTNENVLSMSFKHIESSKILKNAVIVLEAFTGLTPIQYKFLENLLSVSKEVYATITCEVDKLENTTQGLFEMSSEYYRRLTDLCIKNGVKLEEVVKCDYKQSSAEIEHLKHSIFHFPQPKEYDSEANSVEIHSLKSKKEEARLVCSKIASFLREKDADGNYIYKYGDFAIATGDLAGTEPYIRKAMQEYSLDFFIDANYSIESNPLVVFFNSALKVLSSGYKAEAVNEFLASPLSGVDSKAAGLFANYLYSYGYRGISRYKAEWTYQAKLSKNIDLKCINSVRSTLYERFIILPNSQSGISARELVTAIFEFFKACNVYESLIKLAEKISTLENISERDYKKEFHSVYVSFTGILERIVCLLGDEKISYKDFSDIVMASVKKVSLGKLPRTNDIILVGDILRSRIEDVKVLFIMDANEGVIPRKAPAESVLSIEDRHSLASIGVELAPQIKDKPEREEFYLYLAAAKPTEKLYFTYHRVNSDGNAVRPSYVISSILRQFKNIPIKEDAFDDISGVLGFDKGLSYYVKASADNSNDNVYAALYDFYSNNYFSELDALSKIENYIKDMQSFDITPETAKKLYGVLRAYITRIEAFASCPFKHFAAYGLGLDEPKGSEPIGLDYGNVFHEALKHIFSHESEVDIYSLDNAKLEKHSIQCLVDAAKKYEDELYFSNEKNAFLLEKMKKVMAVVAKTFVHQIKAGKFKPDFTEKPFEISDKDFKVTGIIDRIDTCIEDNSKYIKIIDYKSGSKDVKLDFYKLYNGLQLQLMLYLYWAVNYSDEYKDFTPSAAMYQMIKAPEVDSELDASSFEAKMNKDLRPNGPSNNSYSSITSLDRNMANSSLDGYNPRYKSDVVNYAVKADGKLDSDTLSKIHSTEDFVLLSNYAGEKLKSLTEEILKGNCKLSPAKTDKLSCDYCKYRAVCGIDGKNPKHIEGINIITKMSNEEVLDKLREEKKKNGEAKKAKTLEEGE